MSYPLIQSIVESGFKPAEKGEDDPPVTSLVDLPIRQRMVLEEEDCWPETLPYAAAVLRRRSKRNFIGSPIPSSLVKSILEGLSLTTSGSLENRKSYDHSVTIGLLIGQAEGFAPGFYLFDQHSLQLNLIREGQYLKSMANISLDQMWLAQAGIHVLFLSNLAALDRHQGPRGYRYALMSAGRLGERLYLLSSAMGLGCCGIGAFYDQEAADLLGLDEATRLVYLVAIGLIKK